MALRWLEVQVEAGQLDAAREVCEASEALELQVLRTAADGAVLRVLLDAGLTEALSDKLAQGLGRETRIVLSAVEAVIPPPESNGEDTAAEESEEHAGRISREELYDDIAGGARLDTAFLMLVALSAIVAAIGLLRDDVAIIIGAMVIAPLLGPNVATAFAATLGDVRLMGRATLSNISAVGLTLLLSLAAGFIFGADPDTPALAERSAPGFADVLLALAAGSAGALAYTTGVPAGLIGVMVAVALLPPLVAAGLLLGAGHTGAGLGALTLFVLTIVCVNLAGVTTFVARGIRPREWWEAERARSAVRFALALWLLMLAVVLGIILWRLEPPLLGLELFSK